MSVIRTGFFLQSAHKTNEKGVIEWTTASLELCGQANKLVLVVKPKEEIYESVDEEDKKISFDLRTFKRCLKLSHQRGKKISSDSSKCEPHYQIILQKRRILRGEYIKIGFHDKESQKMFNSLIRQTVQKFPNQINNRRLHNFKRISQNNDNNRLKSTENINDIATFLTDNKVYELHTGNEFKVRVIPTDLSGRLGINGVYMMEANASNLRLLDFITSAEVNKWPFKSVRSFGFNEGRLYILTGSTCVGGRGLLILESEKGEHLMKRMLGMMQDISCAETEPPTEDTISLESDRPPEKPATLPRLMAPPTPTKKSIQDLSASLQDFCRTHCCTFKPLKQRDDSKNGEESEDCLTKDVEAANILSGTDDDNLSLDELQMANAGLASLEADLVQRLSLSREVEMNAIKSSAQKVEKMETIPKASGTKDADQDVHYCGRDTKPPHPPSSTLSCASLTGPRNASIRSTTGPKWHSITEVTSLVVPKKADNDETSPTRRRSRPDRPSYSTREVQLLKWRDLPGKEDCYSTTPQRFFADEESPNKFVAGVEAEEGLSGFRGSDIINFMVDQQVTAFDGEREDAGEVTTESISMQENDDAAKTTSPSSSSSDRERQLAAALGVGTIASTAF